MANVPALFGNVYVRSALSELVSRIADHVDEFLNDVCVPASTCCSSPAVVDTIWLVYAVPPPDLLNRVRLAVLLLLETATLKSGEVPIADNVATSVVPPLERKMMEFVLPAATYRVLLLASNMPPPLGVVVSVVSRNRRPRVAEKSPLSMARYPPATSRRPPAVATPMLVLPAK
jgi:hypothetical protein